VGSVQASAFRIDPAAQQSVVPHVEVADKREFSIGEHPADGKIVHEHPVAGSLVVLDIPVYGKQAARPLLINVPAQEIRCVESGLKEVTINADERR